MTPFPSADFTFLQFCKTDLNTELTRDVVNVPRREDMENSDACVNIQNCPAKIKKFACHSLNTLIKNKILYLFSILSGLYCIASHVVFLLLNWREDC